MRLLVLGYKERGRKAVPHVIYAGNDPQEANREIDSRLDENWARMETLRNPQGRKVKMEKRRASRINHSELFTPPPAVTQAAEGHPASESLSDSINADDDGSKGSSVAPAGEPTSAADQEAEEATAAMTDDEPVIRESDEQEAAPSKKSAKRKR